MIPAFLPFSWLKESSGQLVERAYETASKVWSGKEMLSFLHNMGITGMTFPILQVVLCAVLMSTTMHNY